MTQMHSSNDPTKGVVIITGVGGFLGTHLAQQCSLAGHYVVGVSRKPVEHEHCNEQIAVVDVSSAPWDDIFKKYKPQKVFHLAATASVQRSLQDPIGDFNNVIPATARMMVSLSNHSPQTHLVFFSSAAVYGNPTLLPTPESSPCGPISPYGANKYVAEELLRAFGHCYQVKCSVLRIFSAYGEMLKRQLFFDVATKIAQAGQEGRSEIILFGTGDESRDFIHGEDVARAAILVSSVDPANSLQVYNVASGKQVSIKSAVKMFLSAAGSEIRCFFNGQYRAGDPAHWQADISRLQAIGFSAEVTLHAGLTRYSNWLRRHSHL